MQNIAITEIINKKFVIVMKVLFHDIQKLNNIKIQVIRIVAKIYFKRIFL